MAALSGGLGGETATEGGASIVAKQTKGVHDPLHLTLEDNVINYYTSVDAHGVPQGEHGSIPLQNLQAVFVTGTRIRIMTADNTWELAVDDEAAAQNWAYLVDTAAEEWARRATQTSALKAQLRLAAEKARNKGPTASPTKEGDESSGGGAPKIFKRGWFKKEGAWGFMTTRRRHIVLQDNILTYFASVDASGEPQDCRGTIDLLTAKSIVVAGAEIQLVTPERTWAFTANSEAEAAEWSVALGAASGVAVQGPSTAVVPKPLQVDASLEPMYDIAGSPELFDILAETRAVSQSLAASTVVHAGFVIKRGRYLKSWKRRYFVLHSSGVLRYYSHAWAPGSTLQPLKTLLVRACLTIEQGESLDRCINNWPLGVLPAQKFCIAFASRVYYMYSSDPEFSLDWFQALLEVAGFNASAVLAWDGDEGDDWEGEAGDSLDDNGDDSFNDDDEFSSSDDDGSSSDYDDVEAWSDEWSSDGWSSGDWDQREYSLAGGAPVVEVEEEYGVVEGSGFDNMAENARPPSDEEGEEPLPSVPGQYGAVPRGLVYDTVQDQGDNMTEVVYGGPAAAEPTVDPTVYDTVQDQGNNMTEVVYGSPAPAPPAPPSLPKPKLVGSAAAEDGEAQEDPLPPLPGSGPAVDKPMGTKAPPPPPPAASKPAVKPQLATKPKPAQTAPQEVAAAAKPPPAANKPTVSPKPAVTATKPPPPAANKPALATKPALAAKPAVPANKPAVAVPKQLKPAGADKEGSGDTSTAQPAQHDPAKRKHRDPSKRRHRDPSKRRHRDPSKRQHRKDPSRRRKDPSRRHKKDPSRRRRDPSKRHHRNPGAKPAPPAKPGSLLLAVPGSPTKSAQDANEPPPSPIRVPWLSAARSNLRPAKSHRVRRSASSKQTRGMQVPKAVTETGELSEKDARKVELSTARPATVKIQARREVGIAFQAFLEAKDLPAMQKTFAEVKEQCKVDLALRGLPFYQRLAAVASRHLNYKQRNLFKVLNQRAEVMATTYNSCAGLQAVVVGAGPVGLRAAVELALLGAEVTIVERRQAFTRHNILHLWDWVCSDLLKLGASGAEILGKSFFHIGTKNLQVLLARLCLVLGVQIRVGLQALAVQEPDESLGSSLWTLRCKQAETEEEPVLFPAHVVLSCGGATDAFATSAGFARKVMGTSSAMGLVAHFRNDKTPTERNLNEFSWASQYNQRLFAQLASKGLDLENVVYYQGDTHYFVMTPKKSCLLKGGVLKRDIPQPDKLVARDNVDSDKLHAFARGVATYFDLPESCQFVQNTGAQLFDFSTRTACSSCCSVKEAKGQQLLTMLAGDTLLEPFWPEGLGINRGFHTALDAVWTVQEYFCAARGDAAVIKAVRESLYTKMKGLSAFTKGNIVHEEYKKYCLDPRTRYKGLNIDAVRARSASKIS